MGLSFKKCGCDSPFEPRAMTSTASSLRSPAPRAPRAVKDPQLSGRILLTFPSRKLEKEAARWAIQGPWRVK